jgi:glutamate-5-semialdehyde dehydrogenase
MKDQIKTLLQHIAVASRTLKNINNITIKNILNDTADCLLKNQNNVLYANSKDLSRMNLSSPKYDRLKLTKKRLQSMADDMRNVASLPSPIGKILDKVVCQNGMVIKKVSIPFGVVGVIYEARPNVTFDVFALCFKSCNACILKGGSDADLSNHELISIIHQVLKKYNVNVNICTLLPSNKKTTTAMLNAVGLIDLIIPRGGSSLINFVRRNALVPIIETGAGICHTYFDKDGDKNKGEAIINNAKTRRVSVCNALDCLIIHKDRLNDLPYICNDLSTNNVIIYADAYSYKVLETYYPSNLLQQATEESFGTEFLDYKMSIRTVNNINEAIDHIIHYSSKHSECIVSESKKAIKLFLHTIDAACIYANVSTAFTDGSQFGMGAEIGISTQKLHARGPMSLKELTTYKYLIEGYGQVRN